MRYIYGQLFKQIRPKNIKYRPNLGFSSLVAIKPFMNIGLRVFSAISGKVFLD